MTYIATAYILLLGLLIGSFLNVCIYRIPLGETVVTTPSHCMACGKRIHWYDLIPVISYILLKGKCRCCGEKISIRYPIVELLNGAAYICIYNVFGLSFQAVGFALLASALIVVSFIDYDHTIIPDGLVIFIFVTGLIYSFFVRDVTLLGRTVGFFAASLPLLIISIISKGGIGGGDIKLMAAAGVFLGWRLILLSLVAGALIGSVVGIGLMALKLKGRKDTIPFGPFLAAGIMLCMFAGNDFLNWYMNLW